MLLYYVYYVNIILCKYINITYNKNIYYNKKVMKKKITIICIDAFKNICDNYNSKLILYTYF